MTYYVILEGVPAGAKVTNMSNVAQTQFPVGDKFKALIPKTGQSRSGNYTVRIGSMDKSSTSGAGVIVFEGTHTTAPSTWQP